MTFFKSERWILEGTRLAINSLKCIVLNMSYIYNHLKQYLGNFIFQTSQQIVPF